MSQSSTENPMLPDEPPGRPDFAEEKPRPGELESELAGIEQQDAAAGGAEGKKDWPVAMQADDEGPLGEGGQLQGPDAGAGGGY